MRGTAAAILAGALLTLSSGAWQGAAAQESVPSILGTFTGAVIETNISCSDPNDEGTTNDVLTLVFDSQVDTTFTGFDLPTQDDLLTTLGGIITVEGVVSGTFSSEDSSGSFWGVLTGDTLDISYAGYDDCTFAGSGKLVRGNTVVPPTEAGTQTDGVQRATTFARGFTTTVSTHVGAALTGRGRGAQAIANGFMLQGGGASGLSAGEEGNALPFGVWGSYARARSSNSFTLTEYGADHDMFLGGIDFLPTENVVVGLALGFDNTDIRTNFNDGKSKYDAFTVGPYIGALVNDWLSVDFAAAWSLTSYDQYRTAPGSGASVTSDPDGTRALFAGNINALQQVGDWLFSGRVGALWASDSVEAFTESDGTTVERNESKVGQFRVGGEIAYSAGRFEPYFGGGFEYDYSRSGLALAPGLPQPSDDDTGGTLNFGVRYYGSGGFSGTLEYNKVLGRSDYSMDSVMLMLRGDF